VFVRALGSLQQHDELRQADPLGLYPAAFALWAWGIAEIFLTHVVFAFTCWQVCLTAALFALGEDLDFDHWNSFLVKQKSPPPKKRAADTDLD
jgi:polyferredoxin